jgi:hypothetical protein
MEGEVDRRRQEINPTKSQNQFLGKDLFRLSGNVYNNKMESLFLFYF